MGLDDKIIQHITDRIDELMCLQIDLDSAKDPNDRTDFYIAIKNKFDELIMELKYWNEEREKPPRIISEETAKTFQKQLKDFGFPEKTGDL